MPRYEVHHYIPLSESQQASIAEKITYLHSRKFTTPSLFVNVQFFDASKAIVYIGGKRTSLNKVVVNLRPGGNRTREHFVEICEGLIKIWNDVVNGGDKGVGKMELRAVFIQGVTLAALEAGILLPPAGQDLVWLKDNKAEFVKLANSGDGDFQDLLSELETRDDLLRAGL